MNRKLLTLDEMTPNLVRHLTQLAKRCIVALRREHAGGSTMDVAATLTDLYNKPSLEHLRGLTNADFDAFLVHTFERAGYQVHKDNGTLYRSFQGTVAALAFISYMTVHKVGR